MARISQGGTKRISFIPLFNNDFRKELHLKNEQEFAKEGEEGHSWYESFNVFRKLMVVPCNWGREVLGKIGDCSLLLCNKLPPKLRGLKRNYIYCI